LLRSPWEGAGVREGGRLKREDILVGLCLGLMLDHREFDCLTRRGTIISCGVL